MPTPGKTGYRTGEIKFPSREHLRMRREIMQCKQDMPLNQQYKCDPRWQPPKPKMQMGSVVRRRRS